MSENKVFNPLDKANIGKSVSSAILTQPIIPMAELDDFIGAGVYAIITLVPFRYTKKSLKKTEALFASRFTQEKPCLKGPEKAI